MCSVPLKKGVACVVPSRFVLSGIFLYIYIFFSVSLIFVPPLSTAGGRMVVVGRVIVCAAVLL